MSQTIQQDRLSQNWQQALGGLLGRYSRGQRAVTPRFHLCPVILMAGGGAGNARPRRLASAHVAACRQRLDVVVDIFFGGVDDQPFGLLGKLGDRLGEFPQRVATAALDPG